MTRMTAITIVAASVLIVGCAQEPAEMPQATAGSTPVASRTVQDVESTGKNSGSTTASSNVTVETNLLDSSSVDTDKSDPELLVMKIESGKERYFQNSLNDAEIAYRKARNQKKQKARAAAKEAREDAPLSNSNAPLYNVGNLEMIEVNK